MTTFAPVEQSRLGIRAKLLGFTGILVLLVSGFLTGYTLWANRAHLLEVYEEDAIQVGDILAVAVVNDLYRLDLRGLRQRLSAVHEDSSIVATFVLDEQGQVLSDGTSKNSLRGQRLEDPFVERILAGDSWVVERGDTQLKLGRPVTLEGVGPLGRLYLKLSLEGLNHKIIHQLQETLLISGGCVLLGFMVAWWFAARFTRPITALTQAANQIRAGDALVHIPITGRDEIRQLSVALEEMLRRLQNSDRELRELNLSLDQKVQERTQALQEALQIIRSSIQYASRIQRSLLPRPDFMQFVLPHHFVLWHPRDVVGGDLYWCRLWGMGVLLIVGDCTGHGVPGAFMTLIANGALGHAVNSTEPGELGKLVSTMHDNMQGVLGETQEAGNADDGVELGACYFPPGAAELRFVGARFSLFYQDPGAPAQELKGDRNGIGYRSIARSPTFTEQILPLQPNRRIILTTDGMIDQVGGEKRQGLGKKRFQALLEGYQETPVQGLGERLYEALVAYQGGEIRRDDVTVVGFSVPSQGDHDANT
ncbi:MAG: SpoIIE family protein phosphatase [Magnetococcales bacterium]|nr:SpoIIE family protein phosphatase [Magnetococcales bacterium]